MYSRSLIATALLLTTSLSTPALADLDAPQSLDLAAQMAASKDLARWAQPTARDTTVTLPLIAQLEPAAMAFLDEMGISEPSPADLDAAIVILAANLDAHAAPHAATIAVIADDECEEIDYACGQLATQIFERSTLIRQEVVAAGVNSFDDWVHTQPSESVAIVCAAWTASVEHHFMLAAGVDLSVGHTGIELLDKFLAAQEEATKELIMESLGQQESSMSPTKFAEMFTPSVCGSNVMGQPEIKGPFGGCGMPDLSSDIGGIDPVDPSPMARQGPQGSPSPGMTPLNTDTWAVNPDCMGMQPKYVFGTASVGPVDVAGMAFDGDSMYGASAAAAEGNYVPMATTTAGMAIARGLTAAVGLTVSIGGAVGTVIGNLLVEKTDIVENTVNLFSDTREENWQEKAREEQKAEAASQPGSQTPNDMDEDDDGANSDFEDGDGQPDPTEGGSAAACGNSIAQALLGCIFSQADLQDPTSEDTEAGSIGGIVCDTDIDVGGDAGNAPVLVPGGQGVTGMACACDLNAATVADYYDLPAYDSSCLDWCVSECGKDSSCESPVGCFELHCNDHPTLDELCMGDDPLPGNVLVSMCGAYDPNPEGDSPPDPDGDEGPAPCPPYDEDCAEPAPPCPPGMDGCEPEGL